MPAASRAASSTELLAALRRASDADGFLPFDRFEEIALYEPRLGYYERPGVALGTEGDFYTAAHVHPLFAATLATRLLRERERNGASATFRIVELGPGDGTLALGILDVFSRELPDDARLDYVLVEPSPTLRDRGLKALADHPLRDRVRVAASLGADGPFVGVVVANEVLDAQPARRLVRRGGAWAELGARWNGERFVESEGPLSGPVPDALFADAPEGGVVEVSPRAEALVREVSDFLERGAAVFLDYGASTTDLVLGHRHGTLQAIRGHEVLTDPFADPGTADLSVFVDFDRVRAAARRGGLRERACSSQAEALVRWGFEERLRAAVAKAPTPEAEVRLRLAAKNLLFGFGNFLVLELEAGPTT